MNLMEKWKNRWCWRLSELSAFFCRWSPVYFPDGCAYIGDHIIPLILPRNFNKAYKYNLVCPADFSTEFSDKRNIAAGSDPDFPQISGFYIWIRLEVHYEIGAGAPCPAGIIARTYSFAENFLCRADQTGNAGAYALLQIIQKNIVAPQFFFFRNGILRRRDIFF